MAKALIEILGSASGFRKAVNEAIGLNGKLAADTTALGVRARASADVQIQASIRKDARLREEIGTYRQVAASAERGSREQITAANLAERAERRLAGSLGVTAHESLRLSSSSRAAERDIGHATRGALAGSGVFRSFGRSLAFASGGFLAFASAGQLLRTSLGAAREAAVTQKQLGAQLGASGKSLADYRGEIDRTGLRLSALSGFTKDQLDQSLTTILRTTGNVSKALRDNALAADIARGRHIGLAQAGTIVAKVEAGNTSILRRAGLQLQKHIGIEAALAVARAKFAGQARAGTTEEQRFSAVLHDSEVILGTALLPTLNKYLTSGAKWLTQMNESGRLQRDVTKITKDVTHGIDDLRGAIHAVDSVTGGFKNTLEILIGLKVAGSIGRMGSSIARLGLSFRGTSGEAAGLGGALGKGGLVAQAGVASFALTSLGLKATGLDTSLRKAGQSAFDLSSKFHFFGLGDPTQQFAGSNIAGGGPGALGGVKVKTVENAALRMLQAGKSADSTLEALEARFTTLARHDLQVLLGLSERVQASFRAAGGAASEASAKASHGIGLAQGALLPPTTTDTPVATKRGLRLTAAQRNTFFDSSVSRLLDRSQDGTLKQQIAKLQTISGLISKRIAATKDVTRKLNLEDQLVSVGRTISSDKQQLAQQVADKIKQDKADALAARQKAIEATSAREFKILGLDATGGALVPGKPALKRQLGRISDAVKGTFLDTSKTRSELAGFRKVLAESLVPQDVRAKMQQLLAGLDQDLKKHVAGGDQTKFRHLSTNSILARLGLNLTPEETRRARAVLSQIGAGGTVPGGHSQAFALAGGRSGAGVTIQGDLVLNGVHDVNELKRQLDKLGHKTRRVSRRG
jgi:hypothetical protein